MIIEIAKVSPEGSHYTGEESPEILDLENGQGSRAREPVKYDLVARVISGQLVLQGKIEAELDIECSRCTDFFSTTVGDSSFLRAYDLADDTETVDVTPDIREEILLRLPHFPICRDDCKGLCPQCGKDLNKGACECGPPSRGDSWRALDNLDV